MKIKSQMDFRGAVKASGRLASRRRLLTALVVSSLLIGFLVVLNCNPISALAQSDLNQAQAPPPPLTQLSMSGEPGDYIGGTTSHLYTPATGNFGTTASDRSGDGVVDYVQLSYNDNTHWWYLEFSTEHVQGTNLLPGFYDNAQRAPFATNGHPGLNVYGDGRGCNTLTGNFTVHEANFDYSATPARVLNFTATFEQHCEGGSPALLGTMYYNYTGASAVTYTINGRLTDNIGNGVANVPIQLGGSETMSANTDSLGNYSFTQLLGAGNYRLTPSSTAGYVISPVTQSVRKIASNQTVNFTAIPFYSLTGQVVNSAGVPITGVVVTLSGSQTGSAMTDNNGNYSFASLRADGNYTVTPSRTNYGFTPPSRTFNTLTGNTTANYVGTLNTYTLGGRIINGLGIGIGQVTVNLSGSQSAITQTDSNGNYSFTNLPAAGNYSISPVKVNYTFSPPTQSFSNLSGSFTSVNFTGTLKTYTVGGVILDGSGNGLTNVTVSLTGSQTGVTATDNNGNYGFTVSAGGDYSVTPTHSGYIFTPASRIYTNLSSNQSGNFVATQKTMQFSAANFAVNEANGQVQIVVTRVGDVSATATVEYRTTDSDTFSFGCSETVNNQGGAYARCDYATSVDTISFVSGEISKTITIPIINDALAEGTETFSIVLSNALGVSLGNPSTATITVVDDDSVNGPNPIFTSSFFLRQHYLDFLSREPDTAGFNAWVGVLNNCSDVNNNPQCDRIMVSSSFFGSLEFQLKGYFVYRFYKLAFNRLPTYLEIVTDMRTVTGATSIEVFQKKAAFTNAFVIRPEFATLTGLNNMDYVTALMNRYSLTQITTPDPANPDGTNKVTLTTTQLTSQLTAGTLTRAQVLRAIADSDQVFNAEFNQAFVAMQYYGYLRRAPDTIGFNDWLNYLNTHPGDSRTMVNGFVNSNEYRLRFGPSSQ